MLVKAENYFNAISLIKKIELVEKEFNKSDFYIVHGFWFDALLTYFWVGDYKMAIAIVNKLITFNTKEIASDLLITIRFIEILIHTKLLNESLVKRQTKTFLKLSVGNKNMKEIDIGFFQLLSKYCDVKSKDNKSEKCKNIVKKIGAKKEEISAVFGKYFDLDKWLMQNINCIKP